VHSRHTRPRVQFSHPSFSTSADRLCCPQRSVSLIVVRQLSRAKPGPYSLCLAVIIALPAATPKEFKNTASYALGDFTNCTCYFIHPGVLV
jgi:hypothetical protein